MKIIQSVVVKQVLTENSKSELLNKYHSNKLQLQKECDQLRFEMKKQEKSKKFHAANLKKQFEKEIQMRKEKIKLLDFQIEQLHILPLGSELKEKEINAIIDIEIGDRWEDIQSGGTIIIKDGIVEDIR
ncbi:YlqD family protein [Bacillus sp. DTU_2020_1000418_1_SI_GHA_SEK_038]|uniref:YlqD family protein n=1 Tax=Bacillus sp. DTU_2020_1000418_1_SI_GHA_SEK_038 TaxID=3077585 RepID=UPI0028EC8306|nr:YlqD family protein [Bacillus sp. DTU_2020_1000418_1_SI_GHA_SEK_038]WNS77151.1 YlqD family protein [Bacillus sp. DTU_2020_1000418_1_SI_GHA_SEK_038]